MKHSIVKKIKSISPEIVGSYLYEPFGKQITLYEKDSKDRMSFICKEKDIGKNLSDFVVRKYDYEIVIVKFILEVQKIIFFGFR